MISVIIIRSTLDENIPVSLFQSSSPSLLSHILHTVAHFNVVFMKEHQTSQQFSDFGHTLICFCCFVLALSFVTRQARSPKEQEKIISNYIRDIFNANNWSHHPPSIDFIIYLSKRLMWKRLLILWLRFLLVYTQVNLNASLPTIKLWEHMTQFISHSQLTLDDLCLEDLFSYQGHMCCDIK